jgi:hypothetical protein
LTGDRDKNRCHHNEGKLLEQCGPVSMRLVFEALVIRYEVNAKRNEHVVEKNKD